ncbi:MAG: ATP-dependent DNA helicase RecG [Fastidiosipilaceae bacterium]|jgi:ATP-dependent DNA helicase RecG
MKEQLTAALMRPISDLKYISKRRASLFKKLDIETVLDLLRFFPHSYEDWTSLTSIRALEDGQEQVFMARVTAMPTIQYKGRRSILRTTLRDESGRISGVWFNQPYHQKNLLKDHVYLFRGKVQKSGRFQQVTNPTFEPLDLPEDKPIAPESFTDLFMKPIYSLTKGLTQGVVRNAVAHVVDGVADQLPETLPRSVRSQWQLCNINYAYEQIHHPQDRQAFAVAHRRLVFEELFMVQLGLRRLRQQEIDALTAPVINLSDEAIIRFKKARQALPFNLTDAQDRVLQEVLADLKRPVPMSRLVQGDVGSGKTVVAALALLACCLAGLQGAMMAPTSVLATQHYKNVATQLAGSGLNIALLTGQTGAKERRELLAGVAAGEIDILIGTHALLEDTVVFRHLGLAITDEQHRFGVRQRIRLTKDEMNRPHVMVMSATPIPRTLALILYGDLDISLIDELPAGRQEILTYTAREKDRRRIYELMEREIQAGHQCYVICPLVSAEDKETDLQSAVELAISLQEGVFSHRNVGVVYGELKEKEKQAVMQSFQDGDCDILVATTVVEVGVDNPNATFMLIENAERFGLSQLHQLRGRIGRGSARSICVLLSEVGEGIARERMRTLCHTNDGFAIAEADLELRGPGDFFGTRQHGLPEFRLANLYQDKDLLVLSRKAVDMVLAGELEVTPREWDWLEFGMEISLGVSPGHPGL